MNADQEDYFDAIATFVEKCEAEHHAIDGFLPDVLDTQRIEVSQRADVERAIGRDGG